MTDFDELSGAREKLLAHLYEPFFLSFDGRDLRSYYEGEGLQRVAFDNLLAQMSGEGLIRSIAVGYRYRITGKGAVTAEQLGVAPEELRRTNERARTDILLALAKVYEEKGRLYSKFKGELEEQLGIDPNIVTGNLILLEELGYAEFAQNGCFKIAEPGLHVVKEYRKTKGLADEFERISGLAPQPRGRELQKLLAQVIAKEGWSTEEGVRSSHEEMDVIVSREREYYLLECKWEKAPVEAKVVRELFGKLSNRIDFKGMVVSMSGFAKGAVEQAEDYAGQRVILLFGEDSVKRIIYGQETFADLLNMKYRQFVTKREANIS